MRLLFILITFSAFRYASAAQPAASAPSTNPTSGGVSQRLISSGDPTSKPITKSGTKPADAALANFNLTVQTATVVKNAAVAVAARQYKVDLQKSLLLALQAKNVDKSNSEKAEIDRINEGSAIQDGPPPAEPAIAQARKKYDTAVLKENGTLLRTVKNAKRKCAEQLDSALAWAVKNGDLDESIRVKGMQDQFAGDDRAIAEKRRTIDLLALVDPKRDVVNGDWRMEDGALLAMPANGSQLNFPYEPPAEYDYIIEFTRWDSQWGTAFIFSHADKSMFFGMSGSKGGEAGHFGAPEAGKPQGTFRLESGHRYKLRIEVRNDLLRTFLDDKLEVDLSTNYSDFSDLPDWIRSTKHLALIDFWSSMQYHKIEIVEKSGPGIYISSTGGPSQDVPAKAIR